MMHIEPELVARAQEGDEPASRAIIERLHRPILATIHRFLGSRFTDQVEDVGQEVFLRVFRSIGSFDVERGVAFSSWVFTIARNCCFDWKRKRRMETVSLSSTVDGGQKAVPDSTVGSNRDDGAWSDLGSQIERALSVLSEEHQLAFILRQYEGLRYGEIAQIVGVPEWTIKTRIHRATKALRGLLSPHVAASP